MSSYGLVYRDVKTGSVMLGEFNDEHTIDDFYEIKDRKYDNLPETMFSVVDVRHEGNRVALLDLHQFEMFQEDGAADPASLVISFFFGTPDRGASLFKRIFHQLTDELFSGTIQ